MARIYPEGWRETPAEGRLARERETLAALAAGLPDEYCVFHHVHWTRVQRASPPLGGEIDFIVVGPDAGLLVIEQKSGFLDETPEGLATGRGADKRLVAVELARTAAELRERLSAVLDGHPGLPAQLAARRLVHIHAIDFREKLPLLLTEKRFAFRIQCADHFRCIGMELRQMVLREGRRRRNNVFAETDRSGFFQGR